MWNLYKWIELKYWVLGVELNEIFEEAFKLRITQKKKSGMYEHFF